MREMTLSLLIFRVKSRNFGYARARNEINSRDFVNAMYARARNAVISIACKGSSAANVVHTRAQNSVISRGLVVHARAQNAAISRGSTYFNSSVSIVIQTDSPAGKSMASRLEISRPSKHINFRCLWIGQGR